MQPDILKSLRFNTIVNLLDGGFFGFAIGFASFSTVIPLFVSSLTGSATLIGLIPAIHTVGWQFPQLLTAQSVTRLRSYKPAVMLLTIHERIPFLGLAVVAWFLPRLGSQTALLIIYLLLIWQGLGGGVTANPWQNLIVRIIPGDRRATFFGAQSAAANLMAAVGAAAAGFILEKYPSPADFAICFLFAGILLTISWFVLNLTREPSTPLDVKNIPTGEFVGNLRRILRQQSIFRWFLVTRMLSQFAMMAFAFYVVYAVRILGMSEAEAGILTSVLLLTQVIANPVLGWLADRTSRKWVLEFGAAAAGLSALIAWAANGVTAFYGVIVLSGLAATAYWTIGLVYSTEFGDEKDRPAYIGLANTLISPATVIAPLLGGWIADEWGFRMTFLVAAIIALITTLVFHLFVREPHAKSKNNKRLPKKEDPD